MTMTETTEVASPWKRLIGSCRGQEPGPTVVAVCGIHGNEPAGARAAEAVLESLESSAVPFRGEFVALCGNLEALTRNQRFIHKDLNRQWTVERIAALESGSTPGGSEVEDREQRELWSLLREAFDRSRGPAILLDLHTSSADGPPFATMGDTLHNRGFVTQLPVPVILGLEEQIDGALLEYVNNLGHVTVGFEAGRHDRASSREHHEAFLWLALIAAGNLREALVPRYGAFRRTLESATAGIPRIVEMRHRHVIRPEDEFVMNPGFRNFDPVTKGDLLARDRRGVVKARESGVLLLPLYQGLGDDGFFLGREVRAFWLKLSAALRLLGVSSWPHLLPGVRRHPHDEETLIVNTWVARLFPLEIFHLLGYRKRRWRGRKLIVTRRRERTSGKLEQLPLI